MLGGLGSAKVFGIFAGALMVFPIVLVVVSWFVMLRKEKSPCEKILDPLTDQRTENLVFAEEAIK